MSEAKMLQAFQTAINDQGIDDQILAVGQFAPRGQMGSMFAGGLIGDELGDIAGGAGKAVGDVAGVLGGRAANAASHGLPESMLVGVSNTAVYGFAGRSRSKEPTQLLFAVPRAELTVNVHARVNVRVVELLDENTGSRIELEGNRLPITHSKDVIMQLIGEHESAHDED